MRDAWRYLANTIDEPVTLAYLCKLNEFIARNEALEWGVLRTGMTLANKILVSAGAGILTITDRHMEQFSTLLLQYYNTGDSANLKEFLYQNTIHGIEL